MNEIETNTHYISYDSNGVKTLVEDEDLIFAKIRVRNNHNDHFVKKGKVGPDASHFLNPNSIWYQEGSEKAFDKRSGRKTFEFTKVTVDCFQFYLKFLQTKNPAYLRNAEREIQ